MPKVLCCYLDQKQTVTQSIPLSSNSYIICPFLCLSASHAHARDDAEDPRPGLLGEGGALLPEPFVEGHEEGRRHARIHVVRHPVRNVLRFVHVVYWLIEWFRVRLFMCERNVVVQNPSHFEAVH